MMTRGELITWLQNWIIIHSYPMTAKDFEIYGRAIRGCYLISFNEDGSIYNGYAHYNRRNTNATWRAGELIDEAIREYERR